MKHSRAYSLGLISSLLVATAAFAQSTLVYDKWSIEVEGQPIKAGDLVFRVTPRQGEPTEVTVNVTPGRDEDKVAKDVRAALAAKLSPDRFTIEGSDNDITIRKKDGQPDFSLELIDSTVKNMTVKIESE